jgi:hypothetical protein
VRGNSDSTLVSKRRWLLVRPLGELAAQLLQVLGRATSENGNAPVPRRCCTWATLDVRASAKTRRVGQARGLSHPR